MRIVVEHDNMHGKVEEIKEEFAIMCNYRMGNEIILFASNIAEC